MGSTRLPGKMMMDLCGEPVVARVVEQVKRAKQVTRVVLATTIDTSDGVLAQWAKINGVDCFRGSVNDVLDRYYQAAKEYRADVVVRVTGDCPIADPSVIDLVVEKYLEGAYDYVSNTIRPTFPDGLDCEVFSFATLERAWKEARLSSEREHVTPYIWKHSEIFKLSNVTCSGAQVLRCSGDLSHHRWTLDTAEDLDFLRLVMSELLKRNSSSRFEDVLEILAEHPEWTAINARHKRNEGYKKSVAADSV